MWCNLRASSWPPNWRLKGTKQVCSLSALFNFLIHCVPAWKMSLRFHFQCAQWQNAKDMALRWNRCLRKDSGLSPAVMKTARVDNSQGPLLRWMHLSTGPAEGESKPGSYGRLREKGVSQRSIGSMQMSINTWRFSTVSRIWDLDLRDTLGNSKLTSDPSPGALRTKWREKTPNSEGYRGKEHSNDGRVESPIFSTARWQGTWKTEI